MERPPSSTTHRLAKVPLFAEVPDALLDELLQGSRTRHFGAGQVLWNEGDPGDALLVLEEGQLRITRVTGGGIEVVLTVVDAPAALGELALLDGEPRDASVIAQRPVTVRYVARSAFLALLHREPIVAESLLKSLAVMVRAGNRRHLATVGLDVPGRLAAWLLHRANGARTNGKGQPAFDLDRSQGELAAELGTTRSTLNRALSSFESFHLIARSGEQVTILDQDALALYAEEPGDGS